MHKRLSSVLLSLFLMTTICADERIDEHMQNKTEQTNSLSEPEIPQEQIQQLAQLAAWIQQHIDQDGITLTSKDIAEAVEWKKTCKETGLQMSPVQFLIQATHNNNMMQKDITEYKALCAKKKIPYTAPLILFEQYVDKIKTQNKQAAKAMGLGIGIGIGAAQLPSTWRNASSETKEAAKKWLKINASTPPINASFVLLEYALKNHIKNQALCLPNGTPATSYHQLMSVALHTSKDITNKEVKAYFNNNSHSYIEVARDGSLLFGKNLSHAIIDNLPLAEDTVYCSFGDGQYITLSKNQLLNATKESTKDIISHLCHTQLSTLYHANEPLSHLLNANNQEQKDTITAIVSNAFLLNLLNEILFDNALEISEQAAPHLAHTIKQTGLTHLAKLSTKLAVACIIACGSEAIKNIITDYIGNGIAVI